MIAGAGVVDDDGYEAFAQAPDHEEDVIECLMVVVRFEVVCMVEFWAVYPAVEQTSEAGPVGCWGGCNEGEAFCGLLFNG